MEAANGGERFDSLPSDYKEAIRKRMICAKRDGAMLEEYLTGFCKGTLIYDYVKEAWDSVKVKVDE